MHLYNLQCQAFLCVAVTGKGNKSLRKIQRMGKRCEMRESTSVTAGDGTVFYGTVFYGNEDVNHHLGTGPSVRKCIISAVNP